jgi:hypothetical protein
MRALFVAMLVVSGGCPPPPPAPPKPVEKPAPIPAPPAKRELPEVAVVQARTKFSLEVLGIEQVGKVDPQAAAAAKGLTTVLRSLAKADPLITLGTRNTELIDAKVLAGCNNDELPCMQKIAETVGADRIVYGIVNDNKGDYYVHLTILDAKRGTTLTWTGTTLATDDELEYTGKLAFNSLIGRAP